MIVKKLKQSLLNTFILQKMKVLKSFLIKMFFMLGLHLNDNYKKNVNKKKHTYIYTYIMK